MSARGDRKYIPEPGISGYGSRGAAIAAFNAIDAVNQAASTGGGNGTLYGAGVSFTPKLSGKFLVWWSSSGQASAAATLVTFTPSVGGSSTGLPVIPASSGGDAAHTVAASGMFTIGTGGSSPAALPLGTPVEFNIDWAATGGTWTPTADGNIVIFELP
jgi:hypothetical protein